MDNIVGCVLMVAVTFPLSFFVARGCLHGVIRMVTGAPAESAGGTQETRERGGLKQLPGNPA